MDSVYRSVAGIGGRLSVRIYNVNPEVRTDLFWFVMRAMTDILSVIKLVLAPCQIRTI